MTKKERLASERLSALDLDRQGYTQREAAKRLGWSYGKYQRRLRAARIAFPLDEAGYDLAVEEKTPQQAWDEALATTERTLSKRLANDWQEIELREAGPFLIYHCTDPHIDSDACPLALLEEDIEASKDLGAYMCFGGDLLNNWPLAGRLAKQWAEQQCTLPDALLRAQHFIEIFSPDMWVHGNHEEMNPYLSQLIEGWLPERCLLDYWRLDVVFTHERQREVRVSMSHKFQKGKSWFHQSHGHIREMLEGDEADLLIDGHFHCDGVMNHTLPERGYNATLVSSAGYKLVDKYARRISKGGSLKSFGRAHWIVCDPHAEAGEEVCTAFKSPRKAAAFLQGLLNIRQL